MAMLYLELKHDVTRFLNYEPGDLYNKATGLLNRAVRYIQDFKEGRWNHLHMVDVAATLDSTGKLITLPTDFNHLDYISRLTRGNSQFRRNTDYYIAVTSPSTLAAAPTRTITFWYGQGSGSLYLTYWRLWKEFSDLTTEQYPDMPNSGQAILNAAKFLGLSEDEGASANDIMFWKTQAIEAIKDLIMIDAGYDGEESSPFTDLPSEIHQIEGYNPHDGGNRPAGFNPIKPVYGS